MITQESALVQLLFVSVRREESVVVPFELALRPGHMIPSSVSVLSQIALNKARELGFKGLKLL